MQNEILAKYPNADLTVYAVWFNMFPGDARSEWPPDLLPDRRVIHYWDEGKLVGTYFGQNKTRIQPQLSTDSGGLGGAILWDAYLLYGKGAKWEEFPSELLRAGRTIVAARETLRKDMSGLFGEPASR